MFRNSYFVILGVDYWSKLSLGHDAGVSRLRLRVECVNHLVPGSRYNISLCNVMGGGAHPSRGTNIEAHIVVGRGMEASLRGPKFALVEPEGMPL